MKICTKCNVIKMFECFNKDKGAKDGFDGHCKDCKRAYRLTRRKEIIAQKMAYQRAHIAKATKWTDDYKKRNPLKRDKWKKQAGRNRRSRRVQSIGKFTSAEWEELCTLYNNKCVCCEEIKPLTVDHVIPLSKGGTNYISNIQPLCRSCNSRKGTHSTDFRNK